MMRTENLLKLLLPTMKTKKNEMKTEIFVVQIGTDANWTNYLNNY